MEIFQGALTKLKSTYTTGQIVEYKLGETDLNALIGQQVQLRFTGQINCIYCQRSIKKTFGEGYCFPCFQKLARCDACIVRPEKCHYHRGTCREPEWGQANCLIEHAVYLANTTGLKVGITRAHQKFTRWVDQGALAACVLFYTSERLHAGQIEVELAKLVSDRTDWRGLITGKLVTLNLLEERNKFLEKAGPSLDLAKIRIVPEAEVFEINYPVTEYLKKAITFNLDKDPTIDGTLIGIRGQYLLITKGAINIRKFQGYQVSLNC